MKLPPAQVTRAVIQRYARILHRYSNELGTRPFVLPNADFFPDEFRGDRDSVALLAERMQDYAGLSDIPIDCRIAFPGEPEPEDANCKSGACAVPQLKSAGMARLVDSGDSWILQVPAAELRHPVALTTNLARSLAFVFLVETQKEDELLEPPVDVTADLVAVALGFGPLMLQGSYIYAKSCGGPQIASVTKVSVSELAVTVALFAELGGHKLASALRVLDITQREALAEAGQLMKTNRKLVERIRREPDFVAAHEFPMTEPGALLDGLISKFRFRGRSAGRLPDIDPNMDLEEIEQMLINMPPSSRAGRGREPSSQRDDDLKQLVSEALKTSSV